MLKGFAVRATCSQFLIPKKGRGGKKEEKVYKINQPPLVLGKLQGAKSTIGPSLVLKKGEKRKEKKGKGEKR